MAVKIKLAPGTAETEAYFAASLGHRRIAPGLRAILGYT